MNPLNLNYQWTRYTSITQFNSINHNSVNLVRPVYQVNPFDQIYPLNQVCPVYQVNPVQFQN